MTVTSFRDPAGFVCTIDKRIFRFIHNKETPHIDAILNSPSVTAFTKEKKIVATKLLSPEEIHNLVSVDSFSNDVDPAMIGTVVEHEKISFPSYPYEWAPEMLYAAASLTLTIARKLLDEGWGLKDATPYNVLFEGPNPVFIDFLSFEKRDPCDPVWLPYAQFVRTFLLPLLAHRTFGTSLSQTFLSYRDGLEAENLYKMTRGWARFSPLFLSLVTIPIWFARKIDRSKQESSIYVQRRCESKEKAQFILQMTLKRLQKQLNAVRPQSQERSRWTTYMVEEKSYSDGQFLHKQAFVNGILAEQRPKSVLDIGCNMGAFSCAAAQHGAKVVAIDIDAAVVNRLWKIADDQKLDILPLVVDIGRPSPAMGWKNGENLSFLERARGHFDMVMMLAVIHHMLVQDRIPMHEIAALAAQLTTKNLIIEYVAPEDPLFRRIARGRDHLYTHLTQEFFERVFSRYFVIRKQEKIKGEYRTLYWMEKK